MPPMTPDPSHISHNWCVYTPNAEISSPPPQQTAATAPALRGPACSSQCPKTAAEEPRNTKNSVYIHPKSLTFQSQFVATARAQNPISSEQASGWEMPNALDRGNQKTLKPYAIPIDRWIASAAGGTSHRL